MAKYCALPIQGCCSAKCHGMRSLENPVDPKRIEEAVSKVGDACRGTGMLSFGEYFKGGR
jgi:hypothetical protein